MSCNYTGQLRVQLQLFVNKVPSPPPLPPPVPESGPSGDGGGSELLWLQETRMYSVWGEINESENWEEGGGKHEAVGRERWFGPSLFEHGTVTLEVGGWEINTGQRMEEGKGKTW